MELIQYIRLFRRWAWLLVLAAFLAGGVAFVVRSGQPALYEARTTIAIGSFIQAPNPDSSEIRTGVELAQTYAELVKTYDVLQGTLDTLNLPLTADDLSEMVDVRIRSGTSLLVLHVTYTDPVLVADIANGLAQQLILNSPSNLTPEQQSQVDLANAQINTLTDQLEQNRLQLEAIDNQLATVTNPDDVERLTTQRNALMDQMNQASATIAQFSNTIASLQQRTNSVDIVERARIPTQTSGPGVVHVTVLGALVGAALAAGLALLLDYLDDTVRTPDDASLVLSLPVLGTILRFGNGGDSYAQRLVTREATVSPVSEGYRTLRTNVLFASNEGRKAVYLITSPGPGEGKSVTAANLAVTVAQAGLRVLLVDADLRRPRVHEIFDLENRVGLTTLLFSAPTPDVLDNGYELPNNLRDCLQTTSIPRLRVITSGFLPKNPAEILGSALMQRWIDAFLASTNIDLVIIDTPPCLVVADSSVLAATSGAEVLLVLEAGRTRRSAALKAKEQFIHLGSVIKGIVLNNLNPNDRSYGYDYGYAYYYTSNGHSSEPKGGLRRILPFGAKRERG